MRTFLPAEPGSKSTFPSGFGSGWECRPSVTVAALQLWICRIEWLISSGAIDENELERGWLHVCILLNGGEQLAKISQWGSIRQDGVHGAGKMILFASSRLRQDRWWEEPWLMGHIAHYTDIIPQYCCSFVVHVNISTSSFSFSSKTIFLLIIHLSTCCDASLNYGYI